MTQPQARLVDFDVAYDNLAAVPGSAAFAPRWRSRAAAFREVQAARGLAELARVYGPHERQRLDLFRPKRDTPLGLVVFLHGCYWKANDGDAFSHVARGALDAGFAVAIPTYRLAPEVRLADIAEDAARAVGEAARMVDGPIRLAGHSAGGQLAARLVATGSSLADPVAQRVELVLPISGLHDLRPIRRTRMNDILAIDAAEARAESPLLNDPLVDARIVAVVGGDELPELRRQTALLGSSWAGLGARAGATEIPGRHHLDIVEDLENAASQITRLLTGGATL
ncbi:alpha/beta hydrolase [Aureimonas pseudogalii]|uniref:Acetyl esterase/lipase n=1 Tax=Aureimonas pseudogalii TaxID=1744844 RepID=A0A7W6H3Y0_9HYPH|nr:alpha/beta hydrolase [Aureimonas pseudogalii]MBB3997383.1 acetyl esterase/lipase [Aureimonas pseudogalii]